MGASTNLVSASGRAAEDTGLIDYTGEGRLFEAGLWYSRSHGGPRLVCPLQLHSAGP